MVALSGSVGPLYSTWTTAGSGVAVGTGVGSGTVLGSAGSTATGSGFPASPNQWLTASSRAGKPLRNAAWARNRGVLTCPSPSGTVTASPPKTSTQRSPRVSKIGSPSEIDRPRLANAALKSVSA